MPIKATLVIPTLNEVSGMAVIVPRIDRSLFHEIFVVDGGSTDGTQELAREFGLTVIEQIEPGIRFAYRDALERMSGDVFITFSPDGNCLPEHLGALVAKIEEGHDLVIVSRYKDDARSDDDTLVTGFGNWLFTRTINILYGGHYTDSLGIYRAYRKQVILDLELHTDAAFQFVERLFATRLSWESLLSVRAAKRGLKIAEIPGDEPARIGGETKLQLLRWGAAYYFQILREIFVWK